MKKKLSIARFAHIIKLPLSTPFSLSLSLPLFLSFFLSLSLSLFLFRLLYSIQPRFHTNVSKPYVHVGFHVYVIKKDVTGVACIGYNE